MITDAINKTKENFAEHSYYFIVWGWLIALASVAHYSFITFTSYKYHFLPWLILMPLGWIITIVYSVKKQRNKHYETYTEVFLKYLWIVLGISFAISIFIAFKLKSSPVSLVMLLAGIGTLITGLILQFKPLSVGGILFFVCSIVALFASHSIGLILTASAIVLGYLIPAYMLKNTKHNVQ